MARECKLSCRSDCKSECKSETPPLVIEACRSRADHIVLPPPPQPRLTAAAMSIRLRKFIGTIALFVLVIVWALLAMGLAQVPAIRDNTLLSVAYYVIAGI